MKHTRDIRTVIRLLDKYLPLADSDSSAGNVILYIQDVCSHIDYYILDWNPVSQEFTALVDPLHYDNVLELGSVPVHTLNNNDLYYLILSRKDQIHWEKKYRQLLFLKPGIPSDKYQ